MMPKRHVVRSTGQALSHDVLDGDVGRRGLTHQRWRHLQLQTGRARNAAADTAHTAAAGGSAVARRGRVVFALCHVKQTMQFNGVIGLRVRSAATAGTTGGLPSSRTGDERADDCADAEGVASCTNQHEP